MFYVDQNKIYVDQYVDQSQVYVDQSLIYIDQVVDQLWKYTDIVLNIILLLAASSLSLVNYVESFW